MQTDLVPAGRLSADMCGLLAVLENYIAADIARLEETAKSQTDGAAFYAPIIANYQARLDCVRAAKAAHEATYRQVAA